MKKEIIINRSQEEIRIAILEDSKLINLFVERSESEKIVGNIYKGRVEAILPGISGAFVNIGIGKNAYLNVSDIISEKKESNIEKMISRRKEIIVQVEKEPISTKGAKVTMDISLPGRYLVYMPFQERVGVSKHIESRQERNRLKVIIEEIKPKKGGIIIRTEAEDATKEDLKREMRYLTRLWDSVCSRIDKVKSPSLLHRDLGLVFQTIRDYFSEDVEIILVDSKEEHKELTNFVKIVSPELADRVNLYTSKTPIFKAYNIEEALKKLRSNKVNLPSGGYIIIQEAESLCAIDVNTGKFVGNQSQEETVTITNLEAAKEIAMQLRLRNIGGIIVIDFIDMRKAKNRQRVLSALENSVKGDKAKIRIFPITRLGLIEMSRERKRESLSSLLSETCPVCSGTGLIVSRESLLIQISNDLQQLKLGHHHGKTRLKLNNSVVNYFKERLSKLEKIVGDKIEIQASKDIGIEDYQIIVE
ncbi:MAG: Rne/Rng family ribonuclease [Endomicrobiales bacterium]|nr:Rne/Rng family ribonuclease [Endomicrobiales bacterium]